jgi:hypothetical protein
MSPSINRKLDDLVEDVLILILVECEVPGVLAVSRVSQVLYSTNLLSTLTIHMSRPINTSAALR